MHFEIETSASISGRYAAWYAGGAAWRADLTTGETTRVQFVWPRGEPDMIQPDDDGNVTVAFRHAEGRLYRVHGTFP